MSIDREKRGGGKYRADWNQVPTCPDDIPREWIQSMKKKMGYPAGWPFANGPIRKLIWQRHLQQQESVMDPSRLSKDANDRKQ